MPLPRKSLVSLEATPYYHCVSRCVRRAFLCGEDPVSGRSYAHRRSWIEKRLLALAEVFALDVCAYAVMHNHYHLILHVDREQALGWGEHEVVSRWHQIFGGTVISKRFVADAPLDLQEAKILTACIQEWRQRLIDISWYMRCLNEAIARKANQEDGCTGRFWEGRFKSQALLDEKALAACLAYVDLNPIRANVAKTPEASDYTSVKQRIAAAQSAASPNRADQQPRGLFPFAGSPRQGSPKGLPFRLTDYLALVDWSGRLLREDKRGAINAKLPPLLVRLDIDARQWRYLTTRFESHFKHLVGTVNALRRACHSLNRNWVHGVTSARLLLESA